MWVADECERTVYLNGMVLHKLKQLPLIMLVRPEFVPLSLLHTHNLAIEHPSV